MDGLTMNYEANSGTGVSEKSYVNITLNTESGIASLVLTIKLRLLTKQYLINGLLVTGGTGIYLML
jgi:hypothetical protein